MGMVQSRLIETFKVYTYDPDMTLSNIGEGDSPEISGLQYKGSVKGRVTPGNTLEPDVLSPLKDGVVDVSSRWIGFFNVPVGFEIHTGDIIENSTDSTRRFTIQFLDRFPGGVSGHHYEARLETTELERNN